MTTLPMHEPELSVVVPVHHCGGDLHAILTRIGDFLDKSSVSCELVLVDDHGTDPSASAILCEFSPRTDVMLLRNDRNRGKGYSVKRGMLAARGRYRVFTDADLAYPLDEIWRVHAALRSGADVAVACRMLPESQYVMTASAMHQLYARHLMSRAFNRVVRALLLPDFLDTQAGLKGFTAAAAREVFSRMMVPGFGFDLELLYLTRRLALDVEQIPVRFQYSNGPSSVRLFRDAARMVADIARIHWRSSTGAYDVTGEPVLPPIELEQPAFVSVEPEVSHPARGTLRLIEPSLALEEGSA
jgi:dolichyl-phosphate beta-glucosyltransferase